jgi:hypothetical protein
MKPGKRYPLGSTATCSERWAHHGSAGVFAGRFVVVG